MNENQRPEQDEVTLNAIPNPGTTEPNEGTTDPMVEPVPAMLANVDPAKLAAMREKMKRFMKPGGKTISGSEAPADAPSEQAPTPEGKDVDWSEYDLDFSVRHLYPQAKFRMTPQGPKWVAMVDEFHSVEKSFTNHGVKTKKDEPLNLGEYLNDMLNSPEGWRVVSILPASTGRAGVLLQRAVPVVLPDPKPLKKAEEVEAPRDEELQRVEDAALAFAAGEGLTPEPSTEPPAEE